MAWEVTLFLGAMERVFLVGAIAKIGINDEEIEIVAI